VGVLNMRAHFSTMTQILAKLRSVQDSGWDGKGIIVVGRYDMRSDYPFEPATGVTSEFMDASHMTLMAHLLRDPATFVETDQGMPRVLEYAATHAPWPSPDGVAIVDGIGMIVFAKKRSTR
jgi:hypothetical protein